MHQNNLGGRNCTKVNIASSLELDNLRDSKIDRRIFKYRYKL